MRLINADDVLSIVDDLRDRMTVEGYWSAIERVKALPSAQPVDKDIDVPSTDTISRQDAIRIVDGIDTWQAGWRGSAIESIKALPSAQHDAPTNTPTKTPTNTPTDCISRQMLLEYIHGEPVGKLLCDKYNLDGLIEQFPSAQPERKTGRWIHDGYAFKGGIDWMHCSECGHKDSWSAATRTPFCAWCGARMEGES